jgi:hypothetical protein
MRTKLVIHFNAQFLSENSRNVPAKAITRNRKANPTVITDVSNFKSSMTLNKGPVAIKPIDEFEERD